MSGADTPAELAAWLQPLLANMERAEVQRLARRLAAELRRRQSTRIAAQKNPDGSAYAPRRTALRQPTIGTQRQKRERVKAMFAKLRTSAHLKTLANVREAAVCFGGRSARIARIHQFGLVDSPQPHGPEIRYPVRQLLGWATADLRFVEEQLQLLIFE